MNNHYRRLNPSPISVVVFCFAFSFAAVATFVSQRASAQMQTGWEHTYASPNHPIVLHAVRLLDIESGKIISSGEVLVRGYKIAEAGQSVAHPADAQTIDLGDTTLMPGLIDAHVHLFLHPGDEGLQTVEESVAQRTIQATLAARDDLMAGFTAERDMGTEGAGSADTAVRNAINRGETTFSATDNSPRNISTPKRNSLPPCRKQHAWEPRWACTAWASRERCGPRKLASSPSITPRS